MNVRATAEALRIANYLAFAGFVGYIFLTSAYSSIVAISYTIAILSIVFFLFSLRSRDIGLHSLSWLALGLSLVLDLARGSIGGYLSLTISVFVMLGCYELSRFALRIEPVLVNLRSYDQIVLSRLQSVVKNKFLTVLKTVLLGLALCLTLEYFSFGVLIINGPPGLGVAIFASLAIFLIALLTRTLGTK